MAPIMEQAAVAAEDRNFYRHKGISMAGVVRAAFVNLFAGEIKQGGSTITQQYVKNAFVGRQRTFTRKAREAVIAMKLERTWDKNEILTAYLNTIYFGRGAYGIQAAARAYFAVDASRLNLEQAALLAGIIRAPEALDPSRKPEAAKKARARVLRAMAEERFITEDERAVAAAAEFKILPRRVAFTGSAPYFLEAVRRELVRRFGETVVLRGGLRVQTTLNSTMQQAAEQAVRKTLDRPTDPETALVSVDPKTGSVRAMVGGRDFVKRKFNMATQARRQPGSAFKPVILAALLEQGGTLNDRFRAPGTITLDTGGQTWKLSNYDRKNYGSLSVLDATANSVNTVYAQMILQAKPEAAVDIAKRLGITSELEPVAALALGTEEVTPLELTGAYATLANDGKRARVHLIARVDDAGGRERYRFSESATEEIPQRVARLVTQALERVIESGTGTRADIGRPAAGKTGTTENHRDAWFAGYTPDLATAVWMGFPDGTKTMQNVRGMKVVGGSFPARIWKAFMMEALEGVPPQAFPDPEDAPSISPSPAPSGSILITPSVPASSPSEPTADPSQPPPTQPSPEPSATGPSPQPSPTSTKGSGGPQPTSSPSASPSAA